ncbi:cobyric acid synthase [Clostridium botulinum C]|uniref:cobyric acid synthase n=1 Tax=Clostridium botulinum TaxID=1491 RepID=UPI001E652A12|nr:cobyric acid synthase [Clostridium botulinum]MCD3244648.1 cobyric acid synthase [Clostridium botulinum C]MCD3261207.1 cobyric acid synthase [Clostridium botulinum C]
MKNKSIMIQGTASSVGKSILCTALCRIFYKDGYNVNPFKSQNMSLNSAITCDGGEIGRAQYMQAEASDKVPSVKMNPILLKPNSDRGSQVIINGKVFKNMDAVDYYKFKPELKKEVAKIYKSLSNESDVVVIEGAGSPAEINLNKEDFVNMGMAKIAKSPVILVGDIDKGGVFASIVGTMMLLKEDEKKLVKGVIINKFRGSYEILEPGLKMLEDIIKVPVLGVIPYFNLNLEDEDSATDWSKFNFNSNGDIDIAVIRLPYMSNFTDINALKLYKDVNVRLIERKEELNNPDLIIIPGSKSTIKDMEYLKTSGLKDSIINCNKNGSFVFGICGGFQILGSKILDPKKIEGNITSIEGLNLLNSITEIKTSKTTTLTKAKDTLFNCNIQGYEIHMGETSIQDAIPFASIYERNKIKYENIDGAISKDGKVLGTYIHGIFDNSEFTRSLLNKIRKCKGKDVIKEVPKDYWEFKNKEYDKLANIVRENLDMKKLYDIVNEGTDE